MMKTLRCDPALFEKDLKGRVYIVTGANSGTGLATTEQLHKQGATVIAACRRVSAGEEAVAHLTSGPGVVKVMELDLGSLASVRAFVDAFKAAHPKLHGLVGNAGVMMTPEGKTPDGFETQFGVNHLGHFLLTELLLDTLKSTAADDGEARVVLVSSAAHAGIRGSPEPGHIDFDDLHFEERAYDPGVAYNQSKVAVVVYARHLARRLEGTGVSAFSTHPGWVRSNLAKHAMPLWVQNVLMRPIGGFIGLMSADDGAQAQLHCLLDDDAPKNSGAYYSQNSILYLQKELRPGGWPMKSPNPEVYDDAVAERLDQVSRELVGLEAAGEAAA